MGRSWALRRSWAVRRSWTMWRNWAMGRSWARGNFSVSLYPPVPLTIPVSSRNHTFSLRGTVRSPDRWPSSFPLQQRLCSRIVRVRGPPHRYCRNATDMGQPFPLQEPVWVPYCDPTWPAVLKKVCCGLTARIPSLRETN